MHYLACFSDLAFSDVDWDKGLGILGLSTLSLGGRGSGPPVYTGAKLRRRQASKAVAGGRTDKNKLFRSESCGTSSPVDSI